MLLKRFCSALLLSASLGPPPQPWNFTFPSCSTCFRFWFKSHLFSGVLPWPSYLKIQLHPSSYYPPPLLYCHRTNDKFYYLFCTLGSSHSRMEVSWGKTLLFVLFTLCLQWQISACTQSILAVRMNPQPWWQHLSRSLYSHKKIPASLIQRHNNW